MSQFQPGEKWLITCREWFFAPNGRQYRAAFGTVEAILGDEQTLGIKTNRGSTNWYLRIGTLVIAGCQIHYATRTDRCHLGPALDFTVGEGVFREYERPSAIFDADQGAQA